MNTRQIRSSFLLLLTATIWGAAFVAQRVGMDHVGPFTFTSIRSLIGAITLVPVVAIFERMHPERRRARAALPVHERRAMRNRLLLGGVLCGVVLFTAMSLQQYALKEASVAKAGFITALYIVIVPVVSRLFGKRCGALVWLGVAMSLVGLYFLCIKESFTIEFADVLLFVSSFVFAAHILVIDHFIQEVDGVKMSCIQCFVCALIALVPALLTEQPTLGAILPAWREILYAGALSSGVAYTLQIVAQRDLNPTVASLILSLESVMAALAGWLILHEALSTRELIGCALMFAAIILAQLPTKPKVV